MTYINPMTHITGDRLENGLTRRQDDLLQAKVFKAQINKELKLHKLANGDGITPAFIDDAYAFYHRCSTDKAKAIVMVALGNWMRLGKRETKAEAAQANQGVSITVNVIQPATPQEILDMIPEVK